MAEDRKVQMMSEVLIDGESPLVRLSDLIGSDGAEFGRRTFLDFALYDEPFDMSKKFCLKRIEQACESLYQTYHNSFIDDSRIDAKAEAFTFGLFEYGYIFLFPPMNGGADIFEDMVYNVLESAEIVYGVDRDIIKQAVDEKLYLKMICVAKGLEPTTGEDGAIVDHFPREVDYAPKESEKGEVDFKSLNWLIRVNEGDLICDIIPPTTGSNGINVKGNIIEGKAGKMPPIPQGKIPRSRKTGCSSYAAFRVSCFSAITRFI